MQHTTVIIVNAAAVGVIVALGEGVVILLENLMAAVRWTMGRDVGRWAVGSGQWALLQGRGSGGLVS